MKRTYKILSLLFSIMILFAACEEDERFYSKADGTDTQYAVFTTDGYVLEFPKLNNDEEPADAQLTISAKLFGEPAASDLTINFEVLDSSTAVVGEHFDFSADAFTVSAGEVSATLTLDVYNGYPYDAVTGESINGGMPLDSTLYLYLKLSSGGVDPYPETSILVVELKEFNFCPWDIYELEGLYTGANEISVRGLTYVEDIEIVIPADQEGPVYDLEISNLWYNGPGTIWGEVWTAGPVDFIEAEMDASDKVFPELTIPNQYLGVTDDAYEYWITTNPTVSRLFYCDKYLRIGYIIPYEGDVGSLIDICIVDLDYSTKTAKSSVETHFSYDVNKLYNK